MNRPEISDADLLALLLPDSPADLVAPAPAPAPVAAAPAGPLTVGYQPGPDGTLVPVYIPVPLASNAAAGAVVAPHPTREAGPLVPRWAVGTAVASVGVGGGAWLLAGALHLASAAVAGLTAAATAGLPLLVLAGVAVAALAGRRSKDTGRLSITQTITQSIQIGD
ncbi:hypothetical protein ACFY2K_42920 [Kitasatospora sp. NPDC001309]|uniref:hypothetical protein n=1 Tax=Kitasatospora sp. NPDC001309 TaxID=3364013 RepID=UPI0036821B71